jgi:carbonic anhydrase
MKHLVFLLLVLISTTLSNTIKKERDLEIFKEMQRNNQKDIQKLNEFDNLKSNFNSNNYRFAQKPNKPKKTRFRRRKVYKNPIAIQIKGWLKVSTHMFRHPGKFPGINLPDDSRINIKVNRDDFRINSAFDPTNSTGNNPPSKLFFWFRLSGKNLYYASTKKDINILGTLPFKNVLAPAESVEGKECFRLIDKANRRWTLCAPSFKLRQKWVCQIKIMLGYTKIQECIKKNQLEGGDMYKSTVLKRKVVQPVILIPIASKNCNEGWDYANKGIDWNCECSEGKEQSPINLPPRDKAILSPIKPIFEFNEVEPKIEVTNSEGQHQYNKILTIKNKKNTLKIKHNYFGKTVTLDGSIFTAEEIVFHTPSEHQIDGKNYDMEMQVIHYGKTKGDIAKQVVLSFLFKKSPGVYNKFIDDLDFFNLPNPFTKKRAILNSLYIPKIFYNSDYNEKAVFKPFSFYTYQGSLTAPPCSERTIHYVAAKPIKLGSSALELFKEAIRIPDKLTSSGTIIISNLPPENNRLPQPLNGRAIFYYDAPKFCGSEESNRLLKIGGKGKKRGHYEKVVKSITDYYYVNGEKPSGLPGAYVVSAKEANGNMEYY